MKQNYTATACQQARGPKTAPSIYMTQFIKLPRYCRMALVVALLSGCLSVQNARAVEPVDAAAKAYGWLASQMTTRGLIASYTGGTQAYTYDQSVAVIAFSVAGDTVRAKTILLAMQKLQNSSGSFYGSYSLSTLKAGDASQWVGANAWVALAVASYGKITGDHSFDAMAKKALAWCLKYQQSDGGLNGGIGSNGKAVTWASTEHNLDAYAACRYFGLPAATKIKSFLDNVVWDAQLLRFYTGRKDPSIFSDVNALGVLALGANGTRSYGSALSFNELRMLNTQVNTRCIATGFDFDASPANDVWLEGTAQCALAYSVAAKPVSWNYYTSQIILDQDASGGVQYSMKGTTDNHFTFSTVNCVSSTGWLVLVVANYNPMRP